MPFNVSYTYQNPYDNYRGWADGNVLSGIFYMSGISLGLSDRRYEPKSLAPGGQFVTWSAPFNYSSGARYYLYTNSYLQGLTTDIDGGEGNICAFPICFQSGSFGTALSEQKTALQSMLVSQRGIGSPIDTSGPTSETSFIDTVKYFCDSSTNPYSNQYLITNTQDSYEYIGVCKQNLEYIVDFGWYNSISTDFIQNPSDTTLTNIANFRIEKERIESEIKNTSSATFSTNEQWGFLQNEDFCYIGSTGSNFNDIFDQSREFSILIVFSLNSGFPDLLTLFSIQQLGPPEVITEPPNPNVLFQAFDVSYDKPNSKLVIHVRTSSLSVETFEATSLELSIDTVYNLQVRLKLRDDEHAGSIRVLLNDTELISGGTFDNTGSTFTTIDNVSNFRIFSGFDPIQEALYCRLYCFMFWSQSLAEADIQEQNYYILKQRYLNVF